MVDPKPQDVGETLQHYIWQPLIDLATGFSGTLRGSYEKGQMYFALVSETGQRQALQPGAQLLHPASRLLLSVGPGFALSSATKASESDLERFGLTSGTASAAATPFSQTREAAELQFEHDSALLEQKHQDELARLQADWDRSDEQERMRIQAQIDLENLSHENDLKELYLNLIGAERRTLISEKAETGREIMRLGPDPFRQRSVLSGGVQLGVTPQQTAVGQAQAFMAQPLPQANMDMDLAQLENVLTQMQGMQQPTFGGFGMAPGAFGMAKGGVIEMDKGGNGAFSMRPKESYFVGEEGPEILTVEKGPFGIKKVEVTPLAGGFQYGGTLAPWPQGTMAPWSPSQTAQATDPFTISGLQALAPLYTDFSDLFSAVPRAKVTDKGILARHGEGYSGFLRRGALSALGIAPSLISFTDSPAIYYRNPATGMYQAISNMDVFGESGFNLSDVVRFSPRARSQFELHQGFGEPLVPGQIGTETPGFGAYGTVLMEASTGAILPAIHKIARQLGEWRAAGDPRYNMALSAYGNALDPATGLPTGGLTPQVIDAIVSQATPTGRFGRPQRIGWMGTRL